MTTEKKQVDPAAKKKMTMIAIAVIGALIAWQALSMFSGDGSASIPEGGDVAAGDVAAQPVAAPPSAPPPKQAEVKKQNPDEMSPREKVLFQMQQETEEKYIAAMNELQMLKLTREIADENQAIVSSKLATITAQKSIISMLAPPPEPKTPSASDYAQGLVNAGGAGQPGVAGVGLPAQPSEVYTVISVSRLLNKWTAVIGYKQTLLSISVGDVLAGDKSIVIAIDKSGVVLEKDGVKRTISMVPII